MIPTLRITTMTAGQVLGLRRLIGLGLLAMLPGVVLYLTTARASASSLLSAFTGVAIGLLFSVVVPVIAVVLTTSAIGDERRDRTLSFVALRPIPRVSIAAAKLVGGAGTACLVATIGAVALGVAMGLRGGGYDYVLPLVVGVWIATVAYGAVFTPLGYLTERAALAGLVYVFIWESAVAGTVAGLASTSLWRLGFAATVGLAPDEMDASIPGYALGSLQPGAGGSALKVLVLAVAGVVFTALLLARRDMD